MKHKAGILAYPPKMLEVIGAWVVKQYATVAASEAVEVIDYYRERLETTDGERKRDAEKSLKEYEALLNLVKRDGARGKPKRVTRKKFKVDLSGLPANYPKVSPFPTITVVVELTLNREVGGTWNPKRKELTVKIIGRPPATVGEYKYGVQGIFKTLKHELRHMVQDVMTAYQLDLAEQMVKSQGRSFEDLSPKEVRRLQKMITQGEPKEFESWSYENLKGKESYYLDPKEFFTWVGQAKHEFLTEVRRQRPVEQLRQQKDDPDWDPRPTKAEFDVFVGNPKPVGSTGRFRNVRDNLETHPFFAALWKHDRPRWQRAVKEMWKDVQMQIKRASIQPSPQRVARRFVARTFTPEQWKKYKEKYPGADRSRHTIVKPGKKPPTKSTDIKDVKGRVKGILGRIKGVSKSIAQSILSAPEKVQRFVADKSYRKEVAKSAAKFAKESPGKIKKAVKESAKGELKAIFKETPKILARLVKERRAPTKAEVKTLYGVGVYVAGTVLAMSGGGGAALLGAKAFAHSLSLHIGIKAVSGMADQAFLGYEAVESAAQAGGIAEALPLNTGDIPGLNHIWEAVSRLVVGSKKEPTMDDFLDRLIKATGDVLDKGLTDEDMAKILRGEGGDEE